MIRCRLTTEPDGATLMESPYHQTFVEQFKGWIPWEGRKWDSARKRWIITALYTPDLLALLTHVQAQVQDDRMRDDGGTMLHVPPMPADLKAAFEALHLAYTAPLEMAEVVWRWWAKRVHPDVGGSEETCRQINHAIQVIRQYLDPKDPEDSDIPF
jgi:hypothetical protein